MKKHLIVIGTAVLLLAVGLCGCIDINADIPLPSETGELRNTIVGTWYKTPNTWIGKEHVLYYTNYITFLSDGTFDTLRREDVLLNYRGIYKLNEPEGDSKYYKLELTYYSYDTDELQNPCTCNLEFIHYEQTEASAIKNKYKFTSVEPDEGVNLLMISTCSMRTNENPAPLARWADKEFSILHDDI